MARSGRLVEAADEFDQAIRLKPDYAQAHYNLAITLGRMRRFSEAADQLEQAVRLEPDYGEARETLARLRAAGFNP